MRICTCMYKFNCLDVFIKIYRVHLLFIVLATLRYLPVENEFHIIPIASSVCLQTKTTFTYIHNAFHLNIIFE